MWASLSGYTLRLATLSEQFWLGIGVALIGSLATVLVALIGLWGRGIGPRRAAEALDNAAETAKREELARLLLESVSHQTQRAERAEAQIKQCLEENRSLHDEAIEAAKEAAKKEVENKMLRMVIERLDGFEERLTEHEKICTDKE